MEAVATVTGASAVFIALGCVIRSALSATGLRAAVRLPIVAELAMSPPPRWPCVSILIPACSEPETLERALASFGRTILVWRSQRYTTDQATASASYCKGRNFYHLQDIVQQYYGYRYVIPTQQGGGTHHLKGPDQAGRCHPRQHVLYDDKVAPRVGGRMFCRRNYPGSTRCLRIATLQRKRRLTEAAIGHSRTWT